MTGARPDPAALDRLSTWEEFCSASGIDPVEFRQALLGRLFDGENGVEQLGLVDLDEFKNFVN